MDPDSAAAARRAVESTFDEFDGVALRQLVHVEHTDFEHVFAYVADSTEWNGRTGLQGRHVVESGPIRWIEVVASSVERTSVVRTAIEVVGLEPESESASAAGCVDGEPLSGTVHCWHG